MQELQAAGYSPEDIEEIVAAKRPEAFGLWPENETPLAVALDCHWERQFGAMGGCVWLGIPGRDIRAVMQTHRIPRAEQLDIHRAVRLFASEACRALNDREAERAEHGQE